MSIEADLDTIIEAAVTKRIGDHAASIRARQGEVEPYGPGELYDYRRSDHVLAAHGMHRVPAPCRTLEASPAKRQSLWQYRWVRVVACLAAGIVALGIIIDMLAALFDVEPSSIIIAAAGAFVLLCALRSGGSRGGKTFSGTFTGKMH